MRNHGYSFGDSAADTLIHSEDANNNAVPLGTGQKIFVLGNRVLIGFAGLAFHNDIDFKLPVCVDSFCLHTVMHSCSRIGLLPIWDITCAPL